MNRIVACITVAFIIIMLLIVIMYPQKIASMTWSDGNYINSDLDDNSYRVISAFTNMNIASNKLSRLNTFNESLISFLDHKCDSGQCNIQQRSIRDNLITRYTSESLIENDPSGTKNTSYTQFKGKILAVCLREKDSGENRFENDESLKFVDMHELGHISSNSYGHNGEFWSNFEALLHIAEEADLYNPVDYSKYPLRYCGVDVNTNPYYWD